MKVRCDKIRLLWLSLATDHNHCSATATLPWHSEPWHQSKITKFSGRTYCTITFFAVNPWLAPTHLSSCQAGHLSTAQLRQGRKAKCHREGTRSPSVHGWTHGRPAATHDTRGKITFFLKLVEWTWRKQQGIALLSWYLLTVENYSGSWVSYHGLLLLARAAKIPWEALGSVLAPEAGEWRRNCRAVPGLCLAAGNSNTAPKETEAQDWDWPSHRWWTAAPYPRNYSSFSKFEFFSLSWAFLDLNPALPAHCEHLATAAAWQQVCDGEGDRKVVSIPYTQPPLWKRIPWTVPAAGGHRGPCCRGKGAAPQCHGDSTASTSSSSITAAATAAPPLPGARCVRHNCFIHRISR